MIIRISTREINRKATRLKLLCNFNLQEVLEWNNPGKKLSTDFIF
jgi:hypothetical protein